MITPRENPPSTQISDWQNMGRANDELAMAQSRPSWAALLVAVVLAALLGGGVSGGVVYGLHDTNATTSGPSSPNPQSGISAADIRDVLKTVQPGIISISISSVGAPLYAEGTGMILTRDGEVLTNAHVIKDATAVRVTLFGEKSARVADLMGYDLEADVALIKIRNAKRLPIMKLGDSNAAEVGEPLIAIGNALALAGGPSVTTGILSAKDRRIADENGVLDNLLQTDAAINPGNSGGPLLNNKGEVIGMNTAVIDASVAANIGFAISMNSIKPMLANLRKGGVTQQQALLGVSTATVVSDVVARFKLSVDSGAIVDAVSPGSPADDAGIKRFDVITTFDGQVIKSSDQLLTAVHAHAPGDRVQVVWIHNGKQNSESVRLIARPIGQK